jgi:hypothetical protein
MVKMQNANVTTILWPAGTEIKLSSAATTLNYFPEWVVGADTYQESTAVGQAQDQLQWAHAMALPYITKTDVLPQQLCYQAFRSVDTTSADSDAGAFGCEIYNDLRQLFTGIQVAGPKLGPASVDKGFHAIPAVRSEDNRVPACFYKAGDYTCVKDSMIEYWDPQGQSDTNSQPGCWRMINGGERYLAGEVPEGDAMAQRTPDDKCNNYDSNTSIDYGAPDQ